MTGGPEDVSDWCYQSQFSCNAQCIIPSEWSKISAKCAEKKQSPINIVTRKTVTDSKLTSFTFENYDTFNTATIKNNGHTVQVDLPSNITIGGGRLEGRYKALQLHLHWGTDAGPGSEHTIDGEQYPMELHIVHMKRNYTDLTQALNDPTGVAVLGFMYEEAAQENTRYRPLIEALLRVQDKGTDSTINLMLSDLIPTKASMVNYFRYEGSLTTPTCDQTVIWTLFEKTIPLSKAQLSAFSQKLFFKPNKTMRGTFRPVQPLHGRIVYRSGSSVTFASTTVLSVSVICALGLSSWLH
ncbi:carbonic anhydrase 4-like [Polyodon spathula]|uniref:carbonic anhydrase 4-like n=1 Tax=Polyodon spathula TaxID=7913 RepID=UPI001B7F15B7|nr:carbonic anhydrase 4-like [Polyodon spathula]